MYFSHILLLDKFNKHQKKHMKKEILMECQLEATQVPLMSLCKLLFLLQTFLEDFRSEDVIALGGHFTWFKLLCLCELALLQPFLLIIGGLQSLLGRSVTVDNCPDRVFAKNSWLPITFTFKMKPFSPVAEKIIISLEKRNKFTLY